MTRRRGLDPVAATTEGARLLRVLVREYGSSAIARVLAVAEASVRHWASERRTPEAKGVRWVSAGATQVMPSSRAHIANLLGIPVGAWDEPPVISDAGRATTRVVAVASQLLCRVHGLRTGTSSRGCRCGLTEER